MWWRIHRNLPTRLGYKEVEAIVRESFYTRQDYYSSAFDILASYIKGQKILYLKARYISMKRLSLLMMPAIFFSAVASVFALTVENTAWGAIVIAGINAFNGFLLSMVNYLKLDASAEAHRIISHQYDKLQSLCEFTSGRLFVLPSANDEDEIARQKLEINGCGYWNRDVNGATNIYKIAYNAINNYLSRRKNNTGFLEEFPKPKFTRSGKSKPC